jgi:hypothetical protein
LLHGFNIYFNLFTFSQQKTAIIICPFHPVCLSARNKPRSAEVGQSKWILVIIICPLGNETVPDFLEKLLALARSHSIKFLDCRRLRKESWPPVSSEFQGYNKALIG